jgi:hypothetical protein
MSANNKPINAWLPSLAESVTSCPCPPEVSEHIPDTDEAETDGGIFFCPPVNGCNQPLNLE